MGPAVDLTVSMEGRRAEAKWARGPGVTLAPPLCCPPRLPEPRAERLQCETGPQHTPAVLPVAVWFGAVEQRLHSQFQYTADPNVTSAGPTKSFVRCGRGLGGPAQDGWSPRAPRGAALSLRVGALGQALPSHGADGLCCSGGRVVRVRGQNLDVVQTPRMRVAVQALQPSEGQEQRRRVEPEAACSLGACSGGRHVGQPWAPPGHGVCVRVALPALPGPILRPLTLPPLPLPQFEEPCLVASSRLITCPTPALPGLPTDPWVRVEFILDNLVFDFTTLSPTPFSYEADPTLQPLNPEDPTRPFRHKPGSVLSVEVPFLLGRGDPGPSCGRAVLLFVAEGGWHTEGRRQRGCPAWCSGQGLDHPMAGVCGTWEWSGTLSSR